MRRTAPPPLGAAEPALRVGVPDAATRQALVKTSRELLGRRVTQVPAENLHITLAFAGPVTATVRDCLVAAAGGIRGAPFELTLDHVGHWFRERFGSMSPTEISAAAGQLLHSWYIFLFQLPWVAPKMWQLAQAESP